MTEFIYGIGITLALTLLWIGYELYQIHDELLARRHKRPAENTLAVMPPTEVFDQEKQ